MNATFEDPLFCYPGWNSLTIHEDSPCAPFTPPNEECDLIGSWPVDCAGPWYACCLGSSCQVLTESGCATHGGTWLVGEETCDPNPCPAVCCVGTDCYLISLGQCDALGGEWHSSWDSCDADPCVPQIYVVRPDGSGDFATIQAAIDASIDGCVIELVDGTYTGHGNRDISFRGLAITVRSQSGDPSNCVVDCQGSTYRPRRGFAFWEHEGRDTQLEGITIKNGHEEGDFTALSGGAINCGAESGPTIRNCVFQDNSAPGGNGGGVYCADNSYPLLASCVFAGNSADGGGGIHCGRTSAPEILACEFTGNDAFFGGAAGCGRSTGASFVDCVFQSNTAAAGGAFKLSHATNTRLQGCVFLTNGSVEACGSIKAYNSHTSIEYCLFAGDSSSTGWGCGVFTRGGVVFQNCTVVACAGQEDRAALYFLEGCAATLSNTIVAFTRSGQAVQCAEDASVTLTCCDIFGNAGGDWIGCIADQYGVNGNISLDPQFCNPVIDDYTVHEDSPCAPFTPPNEECDLIGALPVGCGEMAAPDETLIPASLSLGRGIPNPFDATTRVEYGLPIWASGVRVRLVVHDPAGRVVRVLVNAPAPAGMHVVHWDGTDDHGRRLPSGSYFCRLAVGDRNRTMRVLLVK